MNNYFTKPGILFLVAVSVQILTIHAGISMAADASQPTKYKVYAMTNDYFTCMIPVDWQFIRDADYEEEDGIYGIELSAPSSGNVPVLVSVTYYTPDNLDFKGHDDFIRRNSRNALGETKSPTETYGPVENTVVGGAKAPAFTIMNEEKRFLHPESRSEESVVMKELLYVVPAAKKGGFHVLHYSAPMSDYEKYLPVFRQLVDSFKGV